MLKKIMTKNRYLKLILFNCLTFLRAFARELEEEERVNFNDTEKVYQKFYAIHVSPILLKNCTAIAGALSKGEIIPDNVSIHNRKTLHHCIGGIVPNQFMSTRLYNLNGIKEERNMTDFEKTRPYAYLDPLINLKGEIIGGTMVDLFTAGNHIYSFGSIVIVPKEEKNKFKKQNRDFRGSLLTYNPSRIKLSEMIQKTLIKKGAWRCIQTFEEQSKLSELCATKDNKVIRYNFFPGNDSTLDEDWIAFFKREFSYFGSHDSSPSNQLENYLHYFDHAFHFAYLNKERDIWRSVLYKLTLPSGYIPIIKALVLQKFDKILSYDLRQDVLDDLKTWKTDTLSFIGLHEFDGELKRQKNKSLFYCSQEVWSQLIKYRNNPGKLKTLSKTLPIIPTYRLTEIENKGLKWSWTEDDHINWQPLISEYCLEDLRGVFQTFGHIAHFNKDDSHLIQGYWALNLFIKDQNITDEDTMFSLFNIILISLSNIPDHYKTFFRNELYYFFMSHTGITMILFNDRHTREILMKIVNPEFDYKTSQEISITEITADILLNNFPQTKKFFDDSTDLFFPIKKLFCNDSNVRLSPYMYDNLVAYINTFCLYFMAYPLNYPATQPDPAVLLKAHALYPVIQAYNIPDRFNAFLEHIEKVFNVLNVGNAYKNRFQTLQDLRDYRKPDGTTPTAEEIYKELQERR